RDLHLAAEAGQADPAQVQILVDGRQSNTAQVAVGYARTIVNDFARARARAAGLSGPPAALDIRAWFNPNLRSQWFIVPGITATLVLIIAIQVTALSVAREREMGTFEQLLVTPLRPVEILIGKMAPALVIGIAEGVAIVTIAHAWFGVPLNGSLWIMAAGMLAFIFAVIGVGLMISSISQTQQQAILGVFLFVVPAVILSGFATPIENMAQWVQSLTYLNPVRYILIIMRGQMLEDMPLQTAVQNIWPLFVIALVSLAVAQWMFRRRLQ
ncbi:MAG: ABC transporter permease, partial [Alphaproteobacteria bacterium]